MVRDTSSGGGLPTCQIWKAYLERQKSYSPDTICYGCRDRFDLEVKIQGQRSPTMVRDTLSGGGLPTCQIWKAYLEWQKSYSPDAICYGHMDQFVEVKGHQQWYVTHRLEVVYRHAKYEKPVLNDKKVRARTRFVTDAGTNLTLSKFKVKGHQQWYATSSGGGLPTCQICKACLERQISYSPDTICYGHTDGRTDWSL